MWILDHIEDLQADFRVFFGIKNIENMEGPSFIALAPRVSAYQGVMRVHVENEQYEEEQKKERGGGVVTRTLQNPKQKVNYTDRLPDF
jgi:hypothetical protein